MLPARHNPWRPTPFKILYPPLTASAFIYQLFAFFYYYHLDQGTTITVTDLFYNVANRLGALRSHAEEFNKINEVMTR